MNHEHPAQPHTPPPHAARSTRASLNDRLFPPAYVVEAKGSKQRVRGEILLHVALADVLSSREAASDDELDRDDGSDAEDSPWAQLMLEACRDDTMELVAR
jgi:hypothetical protein